jgi:protein required for attachment to host cells
MTDCKHGTWVVVCDGNKALFLRNEGDEKFPNLTLVASHEGNNPQTREQGTDQPGRVYASVGAHRSAVEQTDWHTRNEVQFLQKIANELNEAIRDGKTTRLLLVAPPRALGVLRDALQPSTRNAIVREVNHDYTHLPVFEIEKHLFGSD